VEGWECNIAGMMNEFTEILGTNESPFFSSDCQSNSPPHPPPHSCNDDLSVLDGPVQSGTALPLIQQGAGPVPPQPGLGTLVSLSAEMTTITQPDSRHRLRQTEPSTSSYITLRTVLYHQRFAHNIMSMHALKCARTLTLTQCHNCYGH